MIADTALSTTRRVTDAPTRMFHWLFALCFTGAYLTSESERVQIVHAAFGYTIIALLVFRLIYGWLGPRSVRWSSVITKLKAAKNFSLVWTTSCLLVLPAPLILSGHVLYVGTSDWLEEVHGFVANMMLLMVLAHLGSLVLISIWRGANLALPMWRGRVPGRGPDLITRPRVWLAVLLLTGSAVFGLWSVL